MTSRIERRFGVARRALPGRPCHPPAGTGREPRDRSKRLVALTACKPVACVTVAVLSGAAVAASAAEVLRSEVHHRAAHFEVVFEVVLSAPHEAVQRLVTDYGNFSELSSTVVHSEVVARIADGRSRVKLILRPCLWLLCRRLVKVTDSYVSPAGDIVHVTLPKYSDFREARERLTVTPEAGGTQTRVLYRARLVPDFGLPPIVGPWLVRRQIVNELSATADQVEALARER